MDKSDKETHSSHPASQGVTKLFRPSGSLRNRLLKDSLAKFVVTIGGALVVLAVAGILAVIVSEVVPLFKPAHVVASVPPSLNDPIEKPIAIELDESTGVLCSVGESGRAVCRSLGSVGVLADVAFKLDLDEKFTCFSRPEPGRLYMGTSQGRVVPLNISFVKDRNSAGEESLRATLEFGSPLLMSKEPFSLHALAVDTSGNKLVLAGAGKDAELRLYRRTQSRSLIGGGAPTEERERILVDTIGEVSAIVFGRHSADLYLGTSAGELIRYANVSRSYKQQNKVFASSNKKVPITALEFLLGGETLISGDAHGEVKSWMLVSRDSLKADSQINEPGDDATSVLRIIKTFPKHERAISGIAASGRYRFFATLDSAGDVVIHHSTTGISSATVRTGVSDSSGISFSNKGEGVLVVGQDRALAKLALNWQYPEASIGALFGKVAYEGYPEPTLVWQSSGASDEFEPKLSLVPLLYGTMKGTFYALIFAVPVALLGALYTSEFMSSRVKGFVKPVIELLAGIPSVVLGFLAGLWLAPKLVDYVIGLFLAPWMILVFIVVGGSLIYPRLEKTQHLKHHPLPLLVGLVLLAIGSAFYVGACVQADYFPQGFTFWLEQIGMTYDQRNSLVVGIAMGFAIVPVIFTIAEDCLSSVPASARAASLALGANRWQTATLVVLPAALSGVFSAVMIGFGRAVGETMIVLMATGNTPIMDFSMFTGFRAMSANIAVELPEAPQGGTLYRVLFLCAFVLLAFTSVVNFLAELVRQRLRRRLRQ